MLIHFRGFLSFFITSIPSQRMRRHGLNLFLGYRIDRESSIGMYNYLSLEYLEMRSAKIGSFNWIHATSLSMFPDSFIGRFNRIKNVNSITLGTSSIVQAWNSIFGPKVDVTDNIDEFMWSEQNFFLGDRSYFLRKNFVDLTRSLSIGQNVVIGGNGSEFWTHGFDNYRNIKFGKITIGNNVFIGSKCIFNPGSKISSEVVIAPGSVIYKEIESGGFYTSHSQYLVK